ncbi:hypothetical protein [Actinacidiphila glaucinigra]|uniref:hypothetical protein n=1 Tax=Actinacidiphila glaucinigra TaxID=235986 RepID=UPI0035DCD5A9
MKGNVGAGVFVGALFVFLVSLLKGWPVIPWLAVAVMVGTLIAIGDQLRVDRRPDGAPRTESDRPWRDRGAE